MLNKKGISLIVLIITIVILIILATAIYKVFQKNNITDTSDELAFKNEISQYSYEIQNNIINEYNTDKQIFNKVIEDRGEIAKYSKDILKSKYISCMLIRNGKLTLKKNMLDKDEIKWAKEIGVPLE